MVPFSWGSLRLGYHLWRNGPVAACDVTGERLGDLSYLSGGGFSGGVDSEDFAICALAARPFIAARRFPLTSVR